MHAITSVELSFCLGKVTIAHNIDDNLKLFSPKLLTYKTSLLQPHLANKFQQLFIDKSRIFPDDIKKTQRQ